MEIFHCYVSSPEGIEDFPATYSVLHRRRAESGWWLASSAGFPHAGSASGVSLNLYFGWGSPSADFSWVQTSKTILNQGHLGFQNCFWMANNPWVSFLEKPVCCDWVSILSLSSLQLRGWSGGPRNRQRCHAAGSNPQNWEAPARSGLPGVPSRSLATPQWGGVHGRFEWMLLA